MQRPGTVGAGALLCLRAGEDVRGWLVPPCWLRPVAGEAPVTLPAAVSGEAARVRIMVRYILERHEPEPSVGLTCGVDCLPFCWTLDS